MASYRQIRVDPDHPVAQLSGVWHPRAKRPAVYEHKFVLYEKLGPGSHPCHWCGTLLEWRPGTAAGTLLADHLDGNIHNNAPENLVPACNGCNSIRGRTAFRPQIAPGELVANTSSGRTRGAQLTCEVCGATFVASLARVRRGTVKTCSQACAGAKGRATRWGCRKR